MIRLARIALLAAFAIPVGLSAQSLDEVVRLERDGRCASALPDGTVESLADALAAARLARCAIDEGAFDVAVRAGGALEAWLATSGGALDDVYPWMDDLLAHIALLDGRPQLAAERFSSLVERSGDNASLRQRAFRLYGLGLAREALGDVGGALDAYRELVQRYPSSELGARVAVFVLNDPIPAEAALARADAALRGRHYVAAQQLLEIAACGTEATCSPGTAVRSGTTGYEAAYQLGFLLYRYRREHVADALRWLETIAAIEGNRRADAAWAYARAVMRLERHDEARRAWAEFARRFEDDPRVADALYETAWLFLDEDRFGEAAASFDAFAERYPGDPRLHAARWFAGWAQYRLGDLADAERRWQRLASDAPSWRTQTTYWRAVVARDSQDVETANRLLEQVLEEQPVSWYGALAAQRLGRPLSHGLRAPAAPAPRLDPTLAALADLGLVGEVAALLQQAGSAVDDPFARMRLLASPDDWRRWRVAFDVSRLPVDGETLSAARLASPRFYEAIVEAAATSSGLPPSIVWGVMQRESSFRRDALSVSDAMGLMQVIPQTAERIALALDENYVDGMLFEPHEAIRYGVWYLGILREHFEGSLPLAVVAYNAGPLVTEGWVERNPGLPLDEFVEEIVFDQARDYVKKVVANALASEIAWAPDGTIAPERLAELLPPAAPRGWRGVVDF